MSDIQVFDKYGREFQVSRDKWRTEILPGQLKSSWDDADALYGGILQGLNDGFVEEVTGAAERLAELEPGSARAVTALAYVRLRQRRIDDAHALLDGYLAKHGPEGSVLNNLAKVHAERGDKDLVERTLWRSLECDPNNDNSVGWYEALARERGGAAAAREALQRIAALPGSWRARVHLARYALDNRELPKAIGFYREALDLVGGDVPAEVLMTITGDLGKRGFLTQLLELALPRFVPERHGMMVGNNLIKAYVDSGRTDDARALLERLYRMNRPDWKSMLSYWDGVLLQAQASRSVNLGGTVEMTMYLIDGPVWDHAGSPVAKIFPHPGPSAPGVVFIGSTAEVASAPATPQIQLSDAAGRLSRILPLYLSEQAQFFYGARVRTMFPWIVNAAGGSFVLTTAATPDKDALERVKGSGFEYVVVTHVKAQSQPWSATMRLLRVSDGKCLFEKEAFATRDRADIIGVELAIELQKALVEHAGPAAKTDDPYLPPAPPHLQSYLLRLEQLLAIRCATDASALQGVREILEGALHLCLDIPKSILLRALLADVVARMGNLRPDVLPEFRERLQSLQQEFPVAEPAQSILSPMLGNAA